MITRLWRGWTTPDTADTYESLLRTHVFPGIFAKQVPGFRRIDLMRRDAGEEVEFVTLMWFDDMAAVQDFAGADPEAAYVPEAARKVLKRFDARARHFDHRAMLPVA